MKQCFSCKQNLERALLYNVEVDYCPKCFGLWFDKDELRLAKDKADENIKWLDIDLWADDSKFKITKGDKLCPIDRLPLYELEYGDSGIKIDLCIICNGVWLDRGEFKQIINYLKQRTDWEILNNYYKNLVEEALEIFIGPETMREEIVDFLIVLKLFNIKFLVSHPKMSQAIISLPK